MGLLSSFGKAITGTAGPFLGGLSDFFLGREAETEQFSLPTMSPEQEALLNQVMNQISRNPALSQLSQLPQIDLGMSGLEETVLAALGGEVNPRTSRRVDTARHGAQQQQPQDQAPPQISGQPSNEVFNIRSTTNALNALSPEKQNALQQYLDGEIGQVALPRSDMQALRLGGQLPTHFVKTADGQTIPMIGDQPLG